MEKKRNGGRTAPATPQVPDPPVPNRARTEMTVGDPPPKGERRDPVPREEREAPRKKA